jgi:hypothetical protein
MTTTNRTLSFDIETGEMFVLMNTESQLKHSTCAATRSSKSADFSWQNRMEVERYIR